MAKKFAIISNGRVENIVLADDAFAAEKGWKEVVNGTKIGDLVENDVIISVVGNPTVNKISPIEFKLLFTPQERVAMKAARATDALIDDLFDLLNDPRLTGVDMGLKSIKDAIDYIISKGHVAPERKAEILAGVLK